MIEMEDLIEKSVDKFSSQLNDARRPGLCQISNVTYLHI